MPVYHTCLPALSTVPAYHAGLPGHLLSKLSLCLVPRERERLQCLSQPTILVTYRRRQGSNLEEMKTAWNKLENLHVM